MLSNGTFYIRTVLLLSSMAVSGCSSSLTFQVVDASTQQPLPGVEVSRHSFRHDILFGSMIEDRDLGKTDAAGMIVVPSLSAGLVHMISFSFHDYQEALALWNYNDALTVGIKTPSTRQGGEDTSPKGTIIIRMYPVPAKPKIAMHEPGGDD